MGNSTISMVIFNSYVTNYQRVLTVRKHTISAGISVGNRWAGYGSNKVLPWWSPVRPATSLGMLNMFGYVLIPKMRNTLYIYIALYSYIYIYIYIIGILLAMEKRQRYANTGFQPCGFWGVPNICWRPVGVSKWYLDIKSLVRVEIM